MGERKLTNEKAESLATFARWVIVQAWEGLDIHAGAAEAKALELGLTQVLPTPPGATGVHYGMNLWDLG